jgi:hypothetical protein
MGKVGTRAYHTQNSHTTIVIKLVSRWLHMKLYMDGSAEPRCSGVKLEKAKSSDRIKEVQMVRESLKVAQSRQKSYPDKRRRDLSFEIRDFVYLKVSPMRGTRRFRIKGMLAPIFVRPFKIIDRKGEVAYQLEVPPQLSDVHDVFHVSQLKKCLGATTHRISCPWRRFDLQRKANQDLGQHRMSDSQ